MVMVLWIGEAFKLQTDLYHIHPCRVSGSMRLACCSTGLGRDLSRWLLGSGRHSMQSDGGRSHGESLCKQKVRGRKEGEK
jgi:hypothetical protein